MRLALEAKRFHNGTIAPQSPRTMPSLTIKNLPVVLLERLRALASDDERSLNKEVIHLLEESVRRRDLAGADDSLGDLALRQAAAWRRLQGTWDPAITGRDLMDARTPGRRSSR